MIRIVFLFVAGLLVLCNTTPCPAEPADQEATTAATAWLALVDQGKYGESWQEAGSLFKRTVTQEQWMKAVQDARAILGSAVHREFSSAEEHTSLPGVPDGRYIVLFFKTAFEQKKEGMETVTVMHDKDGLWRVTGYYVR